jgi:hypothetical protein
MIIVFTNSEPSNYNLKLILYAPLIGLLKKIKLFSLLKPLGLVTAPLN